MAEKTRTKTGTLIRTTAPRRGVHRVAGAVVAAAAAHLEAVADEVDAAGHRVTAIEVGGESTPVGRLRVRTADGRSVLLVWTAGLGWSAADVGRGGRPGRWHHIADPAASSRTVVAMLDE